jgi:mitochondrial fusion and transport protein UGO1
MLDSPRGRTRKRGGRGGTYTPVPDVQPWELPRDATYVRSILGALWTKEGAFGIWKGIKSPPMHASPERVCNGLNGILGTNSTFVYSVLFEGIQTWLSSLFAATFALPDPTLFDILDSPTPGLSLAAALSATAITALILAPIDIYRITCVPATLIPPVFSFTLAVLLC